MRHGITLTESVEGLRRFTTPSSAVIGIVATSTPGGNQTEQDIADHFPLNKPVLLTGDLGTAAVKAGFGGTLRSALFAIADQSEAVVVVVRVAEGADADATELNVIGEKGANAYTGLQALLVAEEKTGVKPRIIGCPGLDTQAVVDEMVGVAQKLRGFAYAAAVGEDVAEAILYRDNFDARELMLLWPATSDAFDGDAVARALGLRARIDAETGWHKTLSNVAVQGMTGLAKDVSFDIMSGDNDAGLLNAADITTLVRMQGYRFYGNRTCSADDAWAFESRVRTSQALQDAIADALVWAIDKPLTPQLVRDISESVNAEFRRLQAEGRIIGGQVLPLDDSVNTAAFLASGQLAIDYEFTDTAPLENLQLDQRVTDRFYANFSDQVSGLS